MVSFVKAGLSARVRRRNLIKLAFVATVAVIGIFMAVVSVINASYLFALLYMAAAVLGVLYSIIKINSTLPPYAACDGQILYMNTWDNCFFPFNINFRPKFFADFVPARIVTYEIPVAEIIDMAIGTKGFLSRTVRDERLDRKIADVAGKSRRLADLIKRCDILYVKLKNGAVCAMTVTDFDVDELHRLVDLVEHCTHGLEFKTNLRILRKIREFTEGRQRI